MCKQAGSQIFIENALQNKPITINGSDKEKLDFTYIEDLLQGIELCCRKKEAINQNNKRYHQV